MSSLGTALLVGQYEDGSPEWHAARRNVIGGSEIASIMGVGFDSKSVLWYKKAGFLSQESAPNPLFEWGHRLEPVVAEKFAENHPEFDVQQAGSWVHRDRSWHGANPDRMLAPVYYTGMGNYEILNPEAVLEIKTSMSGYGWENDRAPIKYVAQLRWYLEAFGFEYGYLAVLVSLGDYREFMIPRDPLKPVLSMQTGAEEWYSIGGQEMLDAGEAFYRSLPGRDTVEGVPPALDGGKDTYEMVRDFHPDILATDVEISVELAKELAAAIRAEEEAAAEARRLKSVLLDTMGKNRRAVITDPSGAKTIIARRQSKNGGRPYLVLI